MDHGKSVTIRKIRKRTNYRRAEQQSVFLFFNTYIPPPIYMIPSGHLTDWE
jgi:hypothetical protein